MHVNVTIKNGMRTLLDSRFFIDLLFILVMRCIQLFSTLQQMILIYYLQD